MNVAKNFIVVLLILTVHFLLERPYEILAGYFDADFFNENFFEDLGLFVLWAVLPFVCGMCVSIFIFPKLFLIIISQILFIIILLNPFMYSLLDNNIDIFEWILILNVASIIIVVCIRLAYEAFKRISTKKNICSDKNEFTES